MFLLLAVLVSPGVRCASRSAWPLIPTVDPGVRPPPDRPVLDSAGEGRTRRGRTFPSADFSDAQNAGVNPTREHIRLQPDGSRCPIPPGRWLHTATYVAGSIFVFGGVDALSASPPRASGGMRGGAQQDVPPDALLNDMWSYATGPGAWRRVEADSVPCLEPVLDDEQRAAEAARAPYYRPGSVPDAPRVRTDPPQTAMADADAAAIATGLTRRAAPMMPPPLPELRELGPAASPPLFEPAQSVPDKGRGGRPKGASPTTALLQLGEVDAAGEERRSRPRQKGRPEPAASLFSMARADRYRAALGLEIEGCEDVDAAAETEVMLLELSGDSWQRRMRKLRAARQQRAQQQQSLIELELGATRPATHTATRSPAMQSHQPAVASLPTLQHAPLSRPHAGPRRRLPHRPAPAASPLVELVPADALWQYDLASLRWAQPASLPRPSVLVPLSDLRDVPLSVSALVARELRGQTAVLALLRRARAWPPSRPSAVAPELTLGWLPPPPSPPLRHRERRSASSAPADEVDNLFGEHRIPLTGVGSGDAQLLLELRQARVNLKETAARMKPSPAATAAAEGRASARDDISSPNATRIPQRHYDFDPIPSGERRPLVAPVPRWLHAAVAMVRGVVVFGGVSSTPLSSGRDGSAGHHAVLGDVWHFDPEPPRMPRGDADQAARGSTSRASSRPFSSQAKGRIWTRLWPTQSPSRQSGRTEPVTDSALSRLLTPRSCLVSAEGDISYVPPLEGHSAVVIRAPGLPPSRNVPAPPSLRLLAEMAAVPSGAAVLGPWLGRAFQHLERTDPAAAAGVFWELFGRDGALPAWQSPARVDSLLDALSSRGSGSSEKASSSRAATPNPTASRAPTPPPQGSAELMLVYGGVASEFPPLLTLSLLPPPASPIPMAREPRAAPSSSAGPRGGKPAASALPQRRILSPFGADGRDGRVWAFVAEPTPRWTVHYPLPGAPAPPARWLHTAAAVALSDPGSIAGGEAYLAVFGGCGVGMRGLNDVWLYRLSDNSWRELLPHGYGPSPRWLASALAVRPPPLPEAPRRAPEMETPPGSYYDLMAHSAHPELVGKAADAADLA